MSFKTRTIGEIAATTPGATAVFRKHKLDFCCGGNVLLTEAAERRGVNIVDLEQSLAALAASDAAAPVEQGSAELIDHIISRYHETHRRELPELIRLSTRVEKVHAEHPAVPRGLADVLKVMSAELEDHMQKEEQILFPAMKMRDGFGLNAPISMMRHEHDGHGEQLARVDELTNGATPPADACRSWQALYTGIAKLTHDVTEHIHLENNVLFPRFEQLA